MRNLESSTKLSYFWYRWKNIIFEEPTWQGGLFWQHVATTIVSQAWQLQESGSSDLHIIKCNHLFRIRETYVLFTICTYTYHILVACSWCSFVQPRKTSIQKSILVLVQKRLVTSKLPRIIRETVLGPSTSLWTSQNIPLSLLGAPGGYRERQPHHSLISAASTANSSSSLFMVSNIGTNPPRVCRSKG